MMTNEQQINTWFDSEGFITCPNCGYKWKPKGAAPKQCPSCKRYLRGLAKDVTSNVSADLTEIKMRLERLEREVFTKKQKPRVTKIVQKIGNSLEEMCETCMEFHKDGMDEHCLPMKVGLLDKPIEKCKYYEDLRNIMKNGGEVNDFDDSE